VSERGVLNTKLAPMPVSKHIHHRAKLDKRAFSSGSSFAESNSSQATEDNLSLVMGGHQSHQPLDDQQQQQPYNPNERYPVGTVVKKVRGVDYLSLLFILLFNEIVG